MIVLGINEDHNATVALLKDGEVLYSASEERFTRKKNDVGFPLLAIRNALKETGIKEEQVDRVVYSSQVIGNPLEFKIKRITNFRISDYIREMHEYWKPLLIEKKTPPNFLKQFLRDERFMSPEREHYDFSFIGKVNEEEYDEYFQKERTNVVTRHFKIAPEKISFVKHHDCHAYYAYYAAPIDKKRKVAVVTGDGWGDGENGAIWVAEKGKLKKISGTVMCHIARIYRYITLVLGMKPFEHEYKVMGLAPYAHDYLSLPAYKVFKETLMVAELDFRWKNKPSDMYFYFRDSLEGLRFDGIAGGLQKWLEEILVEWMTNILKSVEATHLVFSGGLSMNIKANKSISEIGLVEDFFVAPSGGDESTAIGAAYKVFVDNDIEPKPLVNAYLGNSIREEEIQTLVKEISSAHYIIQENASPMQIAEYLAKNKIIARCAGRMEFGARSLGNRSILCNPANIENVQRLNDKIKFRDFWMPFTPTILDSMQANYLINPKNLKAPYMTIAFDSTELAKKDLKAALHPSDFTARPQILTKEQNPDYYLLIEAFKKITGIGGLLNTSFNLHGDPVVSNATDAWYTFTNSGLDGLILNNTLILKKT